MSDPNVTVTPAAATVTIDPSVPAPVVAVAAPAATPGDPNAEPKWLPERIERERQKMLRDLGVENVDDARAAVADLNAKRAAAKSDAEKAADANQKAAAASKETATLKAAVSEFAARQMVGLTAEQKSAVSAIAGEDPALQLKAIAALMPTWAAASPAVVTKSVDTAPAPNAPSPTTTTPTNHRLQYEALQKTNPFAAAAYGLAHSAEVFGNGT